MRNDALSRIRVGDTIVRLLILLLVLTALPHAANLGAWMLGFFLLAAGWRLGAINYPRLMPPRYLLFLMTLAGIANVVLNVNVFDGRLLGTALLVVMLGLKLLELRSRRDMYVAIYLGFFLATTQFLFRQDLWLALYLFLLAGLLGALLVMLNRVHQDVRRVASTSFTLVLGALPMTLALFLLFPRLESPLWAIQIQQATGVTGIGDDLRMGAVGELSRSSAIAFRVRFEGEAPPNRERYWRGLVLWNYDGRTWTPRPSIRRAPELQVQPDTRYAYELTQEPSNQRWVFALDLPSGSPDGLIYNDDYRVISRDLITERSTYRMVSHTGFRTLGSSYRQRERGLQLPDTVSERTRGLVREWLSAHGRNNPRAIVDAALQHFNRQPFVYTLAPGQLGADPVDEFLFETRRGFCEHFASSFAVLMRLAGIPTRIVLGYQGGEWNPLAEHWVVRQSDAHAWNEVWLDDQGWVRIDPTAAVAPERIEQPIDVAESAAENQVVYRVGNSGWLSAVWREAGWMIDAIDIGWHRWVLGFSHDRQSSLLQKLGFGDLGGYRHTLLFVGVLGVASVFAYLISLWRQRPAHQDKTLRQWRLLQARLARAGLIVPAWFGPRQLLQAATERWPDHRQQFESIVRLYIHLRYGRGDDARLQRRLGQHIRSLKLR